MAKPFHELRERLLRAGVAPRHVQRYLAELADHLADLTAEEEATGRTRADAGSAALLRLGNTDNLVKAMIAQRQLKAWSVRAPWAVFSLAPLLLLAFAYFVACLYLWSLWQMFLPGVDTPFGQPNSGPIYGFENICFQAGKFYYFAAPILVSWGIAIFAARQRVKAVWPMVSLILVALMGGTNHVHASRTAVRYGLGHISMSFVLPTSVHGIYELLLYALVILTLTALPYLIWQLQKARSFST